MTIHTKLLTKTAGMTKRRSFLSQKVGVPSMELKLQTSSYKADLWPLLLKQTIIAGVITQAVYFHRVITAQLIN